MMSRLIENILTQRSVGPRAIEDTLEQILQGHAQSAAVAGLLVALRTVPVDATTLAAMARVMRRHRVAVRCQVRPLIDTCGTGGDGSNSFNISTGAALVVAAMGGAVAKHGNRSVSSSVGSADVLEELGVQLDIPAAAAGRMIDACGFSFLHAPAYHPSLRHVMPARRSLGIRTHFNLLGPLSNPALAEYQVLGVYAPELTAPMAGALLQLGVRGALVVHCAGLDEIGLHDVTHGHAVTNGQIEEFHLDPRQLGLERVERDAVIGGDARQNAVLLREVLAGVPGPRADVVALNAAAACAVAGMFTDFSDAFERAREVLRDGAGLGVLDRVVASSKRLSAESGVMP